MWQNYLPLQVCIPTKVEKGWALLMAYTVRIVNLEASGYRCEATTRFAQVLDRYAVYGDAVLGRFGTKPDGSRTPNVRAVVKPLLGLFHGEAGGRKWRQQLDVGLLKKPASVSEVIQVLHGSLVDTDAKPDPHLSVLRSPYTGSGRIHASFNVRGAQASGVNARWSGISAGHLF